MRPLLCLIVCSLLPLSLVRPQHQRDILLDENFSSYNEGSDGSPTWYPVKGNWQVRNKHYDQQSPEYDCASLLDIYLNESFRLVASFEQLDGEVGVGFVFASARREKIEYAQSVRFDGEATFIMGYFQQGEYSGTESVRTPRIVKASSHTLELDVDRDRNVYSVSLDGKAIGTSYLKYPGGYIGLQSSGGHVQFTRVKLSKTGMKAKPGGMNWIHRFAITPTHEFLVPNERTSTVQMFDAEGAFLRQIGAPAASRGQLHKPNAVAVLADSSVAVTDAGSGQLLLFRRDGSWKNSTGWKGSGRGMLDDPAAVAVNARQQIFVVEKGNHRVQVFDDSLRSLAEFGNERLVTPEDIATEGSHVYILNAGISQVECYDWEGTKAAWKKSFSYGGGEGQGIACRNGRIFISIVNEVRCYDTSGTLLHSLYGRSIDFMLPQGIVIDPSGGVNIADYFYGRIIRTNSDLLDPLPRIEFHDSTTAEISWNSVENAKGQATFTAVETGERTSLQETEASTSHRLDLRGLKESKKYHFAFSPTMESTPRNRKGAPPPIHLPPYSFVVPSSRATRNYARLPMAAIIFANVTDDRNAQPDLPPQPSLPDSEIMRIKRQLADGVRFYWVHSGMSLFLDIDFVVVSDQLKRGELYGSEWWYPPRDSMIERSLQSAGKDIKNYGGILYLTCTQQYDSTLHKYVLAGKGGAFTNGVGTGKGYGISWWDVTRANHNAGNNWLMVHEFNHQLDDIFLVSGYPEYWFNHISPTIGTAAQFGEHFDANRYIIRMVPKEEWLDLRFTSVETARDVDGDGIPDNDPKLPLDEVRLGSDSTKVDTDDDGVPDMDELAFSNWITEGWGETSGANRVFSPNLHGKDSDGDGLPDNVDPYPLYPVQPVIHYRTSGAGSSMPPDDMGILAEVRDPRIGAAVSSAWNEHSISFAFDIDRAVPVKIMIDADNDGWFLGRDNILLTLNPTSDSVIDCRTQVFNASDPARWPFMDQQLAEQVRVHTTVRHPANRIRINLAIERTDSLRFIPSQNKSIGVLIGFLCAFDTDGNKRYVDIFEPNRLVSLKLLGE